jgi:hypothetical protein
LHCIAGEGVPNLLSEMKVCVEHGDIFLIIALGLNLGLGLAWCLLRNCNYRE